MLTSAKVLREEIDSLLEQIAVRSPLGGGPKPRICSTLHFNLGGPELINNME